MRTKAEHHIPNEHHISITAPPEYVLANHFNSRLSIIFPITILFEYYSSYKFYYIKLIN